MPWSRRKPAMNKLTERLAQSVEMLELMNNALVELRRELLPGQPRKFAILAERPLEEIRRLQIEIERLTSELVASTPVAA